MMNRCIDDKLTTTSSDVSKIVRQICVSYAHLRRSFLTNYSEINQKLDAGDLTGAIGQMTEVFALPSGFCQRIGYSSKGLTVTTMAAMYMESVGNNRRPFRGTLLFFESKAVLAKMPRYCLVHMIAHHFSHARLYLDTHELACSEFATDVLALLITGDAKGFSEMQNQIVQYGYIRPDLYHDVFRALQLHAEAIYLR